MAESILFDLAGNIITNLASFARQELALLCGVPDELDKLEDTLSDIQAVILDAEEQQYKRHAGKHWISKLKDALYDIYDLFDEISYEALRRQATSKNNRGKLCNQVRMFFSESNPIAFALKTGHKIKEIRENLKAIDTDKTQFNFSERVSNTTNDGLRISREDASLILEEEVIGRNDDKKAIINLLLKPNTEEDIAVISIVGTGGLGKTALAQSVYNDNMMDKHFKKKFWVCVSDEFELKVMIEKMIESATGKRPDSFLQMDSSQSELRKLIDGKKYLLIMDDVWNEDYEKWVTLRRLLICGAKGSRILITTRSEKVAKTFDTSSLYSLEKLDEYHSWLLFKKMAFLKGSEEQDTENSNLVQIGKEIVAKLKGVPLAIRTIGRLLCYNKKSNFWSSFKDKELYQIIEEESVKKMLSILKLSYNSLPSNLKQCFLYCALFPKDYKIRKEEIVLQWIAQGFVQSNDGVKALDAGEDYFMKLLSMSFFQDVRKNDVGDIITCKMHDLMHDLACSIVENNEIIVHDVNARTLNKRTHHVSFVLLSGKELEKLPKTLSKARNLRTCFLQYNQVGRRDDMLGKRKINKVFGSVFYNLLRLRTLDLHLSIDNHNVKFLKCISKLKYLRYLKIKMIETTEYFPNSITGLYSLEVFILECKGLKELPRDIKNWNKLKHLYLDGNENVWHRQDTYHYGNENVEFLPSSTVVLNNLETLVLQNFNNLKEFPEDIKNLTNLTHLVMRGNKNIEYLPNSMSELNNLKSLILTRFEKVRELPQDIKNLIHLQHLDLQWNRNVEFLPNSITELCELETIILKGCTKLKELPRDVKNWINLRHLDLSGSGVEFLPDSITHSNNLETLLLRYCEKLKELPGDTKKLINLKHLDLSGCRALTHMPKGLGELTNLQTLNLFILGKGENNGGGLSELNGLNKLRGSLIIKGLQFCSAVDLQTNAKLLQLKSGLQQLMLEWKWDKDSFNEPTVGALDGEYERVLECLQPHSNLPEIHINGYRGVKLCNWLSSSSYSFDGLVRMTVSSCERLQHLPRFEQFPNLKHLHLRDLPCVRHMVNNDYPSSPTLFQSPEVLVVSDMPNLKRGWKKGTKSAQNGVLFPIIFPCLSELCIWKCPLLASSVTCDAPLDPLSISESEFLSNCLRHVTTLQHLSIRECPNLTSLPKLTDNLTSLSELDIRDCPNLMSLPEPIEKLTSLTKLYIERCPKLTSLPEGIRQLQCLKSLQIRRCPILNERCERQTGEDWFKIAHIPDVLSMK